MKLCLAPVDLACALQAPLVLSRRPIRKWCGNQACWPVWCALAVRRTSLSPKSSAMRPTSCARPSLVKHLTPLFARKLNSSRGRLSNEIPAEREGNGDVCVCELINRAVKLWVFICVAACQQSSQFCIRPLLCPNSCLPLSHVRQTRYRRHGGPSDVSNSIGAAKPKSMEH